MGEMKWPCFASKSSLSSVASFMSNGMRSFPQRSAMDLAFWSQRLTLFWLTLHQSLEVREVTSRLILRNGVEWGLKGGALVKNAFHFWVENSVQKHFLRTYPGGQFQGALSSVEASQ